MLRDEILGVERIKMTKDWYKRTADDHKNSQLEVKCYERSATLGKAEQVHKAGGPAIWNQQITGLKRHAMLCYAVPYGPARSERRRSLL
jgi:hypothetical protein